MLDHHFESGFQIPQLHPSKLTDEMAESKNNPKQRSNFGSSSHQTGSKFIYARLFTRPQRARPTLSEEAAEKKGACACAVGMRGMLTCETARAS